MKAIERHRQTWQGKSDEWIFERLDNELEQKIKEIHRLLAENEALRQFDVSNPRELFIAMIDKMKESDWQESDNGFAGRVFDRLNGNK